ncbi:IS5 family transposase [Streptomyces sp. NPDC002671]
MALDMIDESRSRGIDVPLVVADAGYGDATAFRLGLEQRKLAYAVGISSRLTVHPAHAQPVTPPCQGIGRPPVARYPDKPTTVKELVIQAGRQAARPVSWREGSRPGQGRSGFKRMYSRFVALFALWEANGIFDQLTGLLRGKVRQAEGRSSEPSACLIDSQSIKTSATVHLTSQGIDPAKKIIGRKRHIVTDTLGLLLAAAVTAASVHDSAAGTQLLTQVREHQPTITKAWADNGYKTKAVEAAAHLGIDLEIVQRDPATRGFHVQPRRWVIERTLGWHMDHRRLARDYETHPHRSTAVIQLAAINLMTRRLTHEATTNWRDS